MNVGCALALALALVACGPELPVPTEPMHIDALGHGHLEKGGAPLDGFTCGERYEAAVTGVPEAEREIRACGEDTAVYGVGMLGFVAFGVGAALTEGFGGPHAAALAEAGAALVSFVVGFVAGGFAVNHLGHGIHAYNAAVH